MPYAKYLFPDRQAVGKATYNLRNLMKNVREMDIPEPEKKDAIERIHAFERYLKNSTIDFNDDGSVIQVHNCG